MISTEKNARIQQCKQCDAVIGFTSFADGKFYSHYKGEMKRTSMRASQREMCLECYDKQIKTLVVQHFHLSTSDSVSKILEAWVKNREGWKLSEEQEKEWEEVADFIKHLKS